MKEPPPAYGVHSMMGRRFYKRQTQWTTWLATVYLSKRLQQFVLSGMASR